MRQPASGGEAPWAPGALVGRYKLLAKLATGGMAEIWLADQAGPKGFQKLVVVKRILESFCADEEFVSMFLDEARIAAQLNHPNVVQIFDLGERAGAYYIAMEYLAGENLSKVMRASLRKQRPLPLTLGAKIVSLAAAGLGHAHAKRSADGTPLNVVHRDVSPQNLLVTLEGNVKVVDFGVARAANRATQTMDGQIKGKIAYMSPEQAAGQPLDARSDVFSLGIILFEVATGSRFFGERDMSAILGTLCGADPLPRARELRPDVPAELDALISTALSRRPEKRFANGSALHEALEEWLHRQPEPAGPAQLAEHLKHVFQDELDKRSELIEAARAGQLTPSGLRKSLARGDTDATMPGGTSKVSPGRKRKTPLWVAIAAGAALVLVGAGFRLAARVSRGPEVPAVVELPLRPPPAPRPAVLRIETEPAGAAVSVDGVPRGVAPVELEGAAVGEHLIEASLAGHKTVSRSVTVREAGERSQVSFALVPLPPPVAAVDPAGPAGTTADPARPAVAGKGKLTLQTKPWAEVFQGKKRLGETPLLEHPLPAGRHVLRLVNAEAGLKTTVEIEIVAGKTTVKKLSF